MNRKWLVFPVSAGVLFVLGIWPVPGFAGPTTKIAARESSWRK